MSDQIIDMLEAVQRPQVARLQAQVHDLEALLADAQRLAEELAEAAEAEIGMYVFYVDDETGPWAAIKVGVSGTEINVGEEPARLREALERWRALGAAGGEDVTG
jgi:hypothetical protein